MVLFNWKKKKMRTLKDNDQKRRKRMSICSELITVYVFYGDSFLGISQQSMKKELYICAGQNLKEAKDLTQDHIFSKYSPNTDNSVRIPECSKDTVWFTFSMDTMCWLVLVTFCRWDKYSDQGSLGDAGGMGFIFSFQVIVYHGEEPRLETQGRNWNRGRGRLLIIGLLFLACFCIQPACG